MWTLDNQMSKWVQRVFILGLSIGLLACSDGSMSKRPGALGDNNLPPVNAPKINAFTVQDASNAKDGASDSATITSGGSVILSWDVTGAKSLELARLSDGKKLDISGALDSKTYQVDGLTADETFELTAFGDGAALDQKRVSVTVKKKDITVVKFYSDPATIQAGQTAKFCWTISDAAAQVTVKSGDETLYPANAVPVDRSSADSGTTTPPSDSYGTPTVSATPSVLKAQSFLLIAKADAVPSDSYGSTSAASTGSAAAPADAPKEVCGFTDAPAATKKYTLTAVDGDASVTQDYTLEVTPVSTPIVIDFTADHTQLDAAGQVRLQWNVTPADATVDVDHGVASKQAASGSATVPVSETTTYTLTATTVDGRSSTQPVTITVGRPVSGRVNMTVLTPSVFAGEVAKIAYTTDSKSDNVSVEVNSSALPASQLSVNGGTITVTNPISGSYTVTVDGTTSNSQKITVRDDLKYPVVRDVLNGLGMNGFGLVLAGNSSSSSSGLGMANILGMGSRNPAVTPVQALTFGKDAKGVDIMYGGEYEVVASLHSAFLENYKPFTVNAFAFGPKSGFAYAGVTGSVLYSDNNGSSWKFMDTLPLYDNGGKYKSAAESHKGCFGVTRQGTRNLGGSKAINPLVNLVDVCDVVSFEGAEGVERLVIATDFGAFVYADVQAHIKNPNGNKFQGGTRDNVLFGKAVNKVAIAKNADQTVLIAAASDGVYLNSQNGDPKAWQPLDAAGLKDAGSVNTLAVSGNVIFAGTDNGLFTYNGLDTNGTWKQVAALVPAVQPAADATTSITSVSVAVKALAVDAADPATLYVGTADGLKLSRDCGASFVDVASPVGAVRNIATAAEGGRSAVVLTSDKGLFSSMGSAGAARSCSVPLTASQQPQQADGNGPGTVKPNS